MQVRKGFDADQALKSAVKKHAYHNQHFRDIESYCLIYPDMEIVDVVPGTKHKLTVQKYKDELGRPYSKIELYLCKAVNAEKNCASENWFEAVIKPNVIYDNAISPEKFFPTTLANQDRKFELDSLTNYKTCVSSAILENAKPAAVTSTDPIVSTKHMDSDVRQFLAHLKYLTSRVSIIQYFNLPLTPHQYVGANVFCPICNKTFFIKEIKGNAAVCLIRKTQRNITDITNHTDAEEATSYIDLNANDSDKSDTADTRSQFCQKLNLY